MDYLEEKITNFYEFFNLYTPISRFFFTAIAVGILIRIAKTRLTIGSGGATRKIADIPGWLIVAFLAGAAAALFI